MSNKEYIFFFKKYTKVQEPKSTRLDKREAKGREVLFNKISPENRMLTNANVRKTILSF